MQPNLPCPALASQVMGKACAIMLSFPILFFSVIFFLFSLYFCAKEEIQLSGTGYLSSGLELPH